MAGSGALIVDVGGVLTTPIRESFSAFCAGEGVERNALDSLFGDLLDVSDEGHPVAQLEAGSMEIAAFDGWLAATINEATGRALPADGLTRRLLSGVALEARMLDAVRLARAAGVPVGLLSNSWGSTDYGPLADLFDAVVISGAERIRKPDPRIYRLTADRLGVDVSSCVFVDDAAVNCAGAVAVGMRAIHHVDPVTTIAGLEEVLGIELGSSPE